MPVTDQQRARNTAYAEYWKSRIEPIESQHAAYTDRLNDYGRLVITQGFVLNSGGLAGVVLLAQYLKDHNLIFLQQAIPGVVAFCIGLALCALAGGAGYANYALWDMHTRDLADLADAEARQIFLGEEYELPSEKALEREEDKRVKWTNLLVWAGAIFAVGGYLAAAVAAILIAMVL